MKNHYQYRFILACFVIASQLVFYAAPALSSELPHTGGPVVEETSEPIVEEPVPAPEPVVEEPAPEPPAEESVPAIEETVTEELVVEESSTEEEPVVEEETIVVEAVGDETTIDQTTEAPTQEVAVAETTTEETVTIEEEVVAEEPAIEEPVVEEEVTEEPVVEETPAEEPVIAEPVIEEEVVEEPIVEEVVSEPQVLGSSVEEEVIQSPELTTDKADYLLGETATIFGKFFNSFQTIFLTIFGGSQDDGTYTETTQNLTSDLAGLFTTTYTLDLIYRPLYTLIARNAEGQELAQTTFTDAPPAANLDQLRNGSPSSPNDPGQWANGNLGSQTAHYVEGYSVAYRAVLTNLPLNTPITLTLGYDIKHSNRHALDYLTSYDRIGRSGTNNPQHNTVFSHSAETISPLVGTSLVTAPNTFPIPAPSSAGSPVVDQPTTSFDNLPANQKQMSLYGGTISGITYLTQGDLNASNSSTQVNVTFSATSTTAVLAWGGHIGSREDWGFDAGVPRSAGGISGSPYHMRLIGWTLNNLGNQDRSLSAVAVFSPPTGSITLDKITDPAEDPTLFDFSTTGLPNPTNPSLADTTTPVTWSALGEGTYTITETVPAGWALTGRNCVGATDSIITNITNGVQIELAADENITCTFTNTKLGTIIVEKQTDPDQTAGDFTFTGDAAGTIQDDGQIIVSNLLPGQYTSTENDPSPEFALASIICDDGQSATPSSGDTGTRTATFNLDPGETVICVFTNELQLGHITIVKDAVPDGPQDFNFTGDLGDYDLDDDADNTLSNSITFDVLAGTYFNWENLPAGWDLTSATCDNNSVLPDIDVAAGESVTCTYVNKPVSVTLEKIGDEISKIGDSVDYTITVTNTSPGDTRDLTCTITDVILGINEQVVLSPGNNHIINVNGFVIPDDASDPFVNTAEVNCSLPDSQFVDASAQDAWQTNLFQPAIELTKTGDELSKIGDPVNYTITLNNNSSQDTPDLNCTVTDATVGVNENFNIASGATNDILVNGFIIPDNASDPFVNTASVTCSPEGFPNTYEDSAEWQTNLFQPSITIDKVGDELSKIGDEVNYTITVNNTSSGDSPDLDCTISDPTVGLNKNVTLSSGANDISQVAIQVPDNASDPFVNEATVTCNPQGFLNVLEASDFWETALFQPAIELFKIGDELSKIGDEVNYTITLENNSSGDSPDLECTITDPTLNFVKQITLASGASDVSNIPFVIPDNASDPFVNTASVTCSPQGFPNVYEDTAEWQTELFQPSIELTKTGDELSKIGDLVDYVITLFNNSSDDTPDLDCTVTDPTVGVNEVFSVASGQNQVINVNGFVIPDNASDPFINTASVTCSPQGFSNTYEDSAEWQTELFQPSILLEKTGDELSKIGDTVDYVITLSNNSSGDTPDLNCTITDGTVGVNEAFSLPSGQQYIVNVNNFIIPENASDPFVNTASVTCSPEGFPNIYTDEATWETNLFQPSITIDKIGDELSKIGDEVNYTITLNNTSSDDTPDLECTITDPVVGLDKNVSLASGANDVSNVPFVIPENAQDPFVNEVSVTCSPVGFLNIYEASDSWETALFQPAIELTKTGDELSKIGDPVDYVITLFNNSSDDTPDLDCTVTDGTVGVNEAFSVASGQNHVINVNNFIIPENASDPFINTASVTCSPEGFPNVYEDSAEWQTELFQPDITLNKTGDELSKIGDEVNYTVTLDNNSSVDTPDLECTITDATLGFVKQVTLASGASDVSNIPFIIPDDASDPFVNTASVTCSPEGFPNVYEDSAEWQTELFQPEIEIIKEGEPLSKVGDPVNYTITLNNNSSPDTPDLNCTIDDPLIGFGKQVTLASGASDISNIPFVIPDNAPDPFINEVSVTCSPEGFPNIYEASDSWETALFQPAIELTKTGDELSKIGDEVDYVITLFNNSSDDTPDLDCTITDPTVGVDENFTVAAGANHVINVNDFIIPENASDPFVNTASVTCSPQGFPNVYEDTAEWQTELFQPEILLEKTGDLYSKAGDEVNYTITLSNNSSNDTPNLECTIIDSLLGINAPVVLASGAQVAINQGYVVPDDAPDPLVNTATVVCSPDGFPNQYEAEATWEVDLFHPSYTVSKQCTTPLVIPGEEAVFSVVFENTGDIDLIITADEDLLDGLDTITAGTPFDLLEGQIRIFEVHQVAGNTETVDNTVNSVATLPEFTGLANELPGSASDSCVVAATKSGFKWNDLNADGIWDQDEPGLPDWTIEVLDDQNQVVQSTSTAADGSYFFYLAPGDYTVQEVCPAQGWGQSYPTPTNGCGSGVHAVSLIGGQVDDDNNFGNYELGRITIVKDADPNSCKDFDFNGDLGGFVLDDDEGVTECITDPVDQPQSKTFENLPINTAYTVTETLPDFWELQAPIVCTGADELQITQIANGITIDLKPGDDITCTFVNEKISPTRTQGFWQTHTSFTSDIFEQHFGIAGMLIGDGGPHKAYITNIESTGDSQLFGAYYSNIANTTQTSPGKGKKPVKRSNVDKTRMVLLQQLVTAKLNCAAFGGCPSSITTLIADADAAYAASNIGDMNTLTGLLDDFNNSGDTIIISPPLPFQGKATPKDSKDLADLGFWDTP